MKGLFGEERSPLIGRDITAFACVYRDQGRNQKAESLQMQWLDEVADILEEEHPVKIFEKSKLAGIHYRQYWPVEVDL